MAWKKEKEKKDPRYKKRKILKQISYFLWDRIPNQ